LYSSSSKATAVNPDQKFIRASGDDLNSW